MSQHDDQRDTSQTTGDNSKEFYSFVYSTWGQQAMSDHQNGKSPTTATDEALLLLNEAISLGRRYGMAGQHLDAMCSARDAIERLREDVAMWQRAYTEAHVRYRQALDRDILT